MLTAAMAVHVLMGLLLLVGPIMAEDWFFLTAPPLATDLVASQRIGAVTAGIVAVVASACVVVALAMQRQAAAGRVAAASSVSDVSPVLVLRVTVRRRSAVSSAAGSRRSG